MSDFEHELGAARRVGLYGGTFDPVHIGHLIAATEVRARLGLDLVLFLPAGQPPHKHDRAIAPADHRVAMLALATAGRPGFAVSRFDLDHQGPAYTADLLRRAHAAAGPPRDFFFIMGEDSLRDFPQWRAPDEIARLAYLAVVTRPNVAVDLEAIARAVPDLAGRVHCVPMPQIDISSRDLRARVATGQPIAYQAPRAVEEYILRTGLYRSP